MSIDVRRLSLRGMVICTLVTLWSAPAAIAQPWTDQAAQAAPVAQPATTPPGPRGGTAPEKYRVLMGQRNRSTQPFQIILLVAEMQGAAGTEGLPKSALRALDDLKDFLPFKSYRALDMAWIRTTGSAETRLTGPTGQAYYVRLNAQLGDSNARGEKIYVSSFELRDGDGHMLTPRPAGGGGGTTTEREAERARQSAVDMLTVTRGGSRIISTSFGMEVGETVVVGTSKITGGDKALVVLLTAVPPTVSR